MSVLDRSLEQWCRNMDVEVMRNEELESLIDPLLKVCSGPKEGIINPLLKILDCEDLLLSIVRVNTSSSNLRERVAFCVMIMKRLISLSRHKDWKIIILLFKIILESNFKEKTTLIQDVWSKHELSRMPAEMILVLLNHEPAFIEKQLCHLYSMARISDENIWQNDCFHCWIFWCSTSAELFFLVSSIFNQFLIYTKANSVILTIVYKFIINIIAECERNQSNILSLYPIEYQSIVASLMIEPDFNPLRNIIIKKIIFIKKEDSKAFLLLLSHFPKWMNVFNNF